jgi:polyribonucleotide nucleotidyltransferase
MSQKEIIKELELGGRTLTLKTGLLAPQATSAVLAQYGETVVLATVVATPMKVELDYFPLSVEYQERLYAGGRIKGSRWVKREGRPTDEEILKGRLIDRSIRPLFPHDYKADVQVIITILSVDIENDPAVVAPIAVSAALSASPIPWMGPVSIVNVGLKDGKYFVNPKDSEMKDSQMELTVSSTKNAIIMIEAGAKEVTEEEILGGIEFGLKEGTKVIKFIDEFAKAVGNKKWAVEKSAVTPELEKTVKKLVADKLDSVIDSLAKVENGRSTEFDELVAAVKEAVSDEEKPFIAEMVDHLKKDRIREMVLKGKRVDGRKLDEVRPLASMVGVLPRTHGSAIFQRGATQVMSVATLGAPSMGQLLESAEGEEEKRYIHHYVMAPFSTGETGRVGQPGRREIGHGALAERALLPVIPAEDKFPYAIRIVSEVLSSNGSTSMASTCGSTLSLMDAGVPITSPVSGIAMGLIIEDEKNFAVMTDIAGIEDFNGDMDFKVAGTAKGITALQLDVKTLNLSLPIMEKAIAQAKKGRAHILENMLAAIDKPREVVSIHAPKIEEVRVPAEMIGEIIGPGGKNIKKIIADTGAQVEVTDKEDHGIVNISGISRESVEKAKKIIEGIIKVVEPGEIYEGTVRRIQPFGAFIEILPGKEGMVHVSDMGEGFVESPESVVSLDQKVQVRVKEIDSMGRINLSMRMDASTDEKRPPRNDRGGERRFGDRNGGGRPPFRGGRSGGFGRSMGGGGFNRSGGGGGRRFERRDGGNDRPRGSSSGPHFPASRLVDSPRGKKFDR